MKYEVKTKVVAEVELCAEVQAVKSECLSEKFEELICELHKGEFCSGVFRVQVIRVVEESRCFTVRKL